MIFRSLIITLLIIFSACHSGEVIKKDMSGVVRDSLNFTTIKWIDSVKSVGSVEAGTKTEIRFRFRNTGDKPLFIISAQPGCGCTVADYPKEAILPGVEGIITAAYDLKKGTEGEFRKSIRVTTNTKGTTSHSIFLYGVVKKSGDEIALTKTDTAELNSIRTKELKTHIFLNSTKN